AATASSRVETLPMFVRSRPSRTRAERPIPGDRVLDAFDRSRAGTLEADESGRTPGILAVTAAEGGPNALCLSWRRSGPDSQPYLDVESPGGISPPGAPKTVREPLDSHGSRCSAVSMT